MAWKNFGSGFFSCWEEEQQEKPCSLASQRGRAGTAQVSGSSKMLHANPCSCPFFGPPWDWIHDGEPSYEEWAALHRSFILSWGA